MANRFVLPLETPVDATGAPYPGGQLFFYQSGTSTKLTTYSDSALTIANTNPVVLDSAGRFPNAIFLQNAAYSVIFTTEDDIDPPTSPIWTQDPVYTSDYSARAKFTSGSGSPNGSVAGTAGSVGIGADSYWDTANNILYICTTTGTTTTAVWTAVNAATAAAVIPPPQGRLTPTSGVPVIGGDVTAATAIYYTPCVGNLCPIYNGTSFVPIAFTEQTLVLVSSHAANNIYDVFMFNNSGVPTIVTGPSWSAGTSGSITAGACARGTGTGGTALAVVSGINTNATSMIGRNGNTTYTINANIATYLGSLFMDDTNGQVSCYLSWGQSRKWGVWNAYNDAPLILQVGDSTASWTILGVATIRPSNGNNANAGTSFAGLPVTPIECKFSQTIGAFGSTAPTAAQILIGINSTTAGTGKFGSVSNGAASIEIDASAESYAVVNPALGIQVISCLESGAATRSVYYGTNADMVLSIKWRG